MINSNRIVPIQVMDLLTMYSIILNLADKTVTALTATDALGDYEVTSNPSGAVLADQPVQTLDFGEDVTAATVYFVPAFDYSGFTINGTAVTTEGVDVVADGRTLYSATLASGTVTIAQIGL